MAGSLTEFRERSLEAALNLLWRQWCSLGVAGHAPAADPHWIIDLETLVLATTSIARHDPRLFDESLDWLSRFTPLLHLQRLKTIHADAGLGDQAVLGALADWLANHGGQPKWKAFGNRQDPTPEPVPLFHMPFSGTADPAFAARGLLRPPVTLRCMSRPPDPTRPPNLLLTLRALIGVSARAEVILCLASGPAAHPAEIARLTGYKPRTMQILLQEMSMSGHILTEETASRLSGKKVRGSSRRYHLRTEDWVFLTNGRPLPRWRVWIPLWRLIQTLLDILPGPGQAEKHPLVVSARLRDQLETDGRQLAAAGWLPLLDLRSGAPGVELLESLADNLPPLLDSL